jgi:uncharacterized protein (DUF58 family)
VALTGRLAALAAFVAVALLLAPGAGWRAYWLANLGLVLLVVLDLVLAAGVRGLVLTRSGATSVRLGEQAVVSMVVANGSARTARLVVRDAWPPSAAADPRVHRLHVPAGERRRVETTLHPTRRGDRRPERVTVRSLGPLGLAGRQGRHVAPWQVRVLPPFTSRKFLPERLNRLRRLDGAVLVRGRGAGTEFDSLRDYVAGDDVRSIDWRATARRDSVVVRTWRPERDRRVVAVLDTGRTSAGRVGDAPRLDHAMDAALLLAALASRAGDQVELLAYDRVQRARVSGGSRTEVLSSLVNAMATLEPVLVEADHRGIVAAVLKRVRRRGLVVLFTELNTAVVEEGLLPALGVLTARHTVIVASVGDPTVDAMLRGRSTVQAVYGAAAAERATAERRRLVALLRRRGVEVVDAPPASFAPAVADAYLALKAAGRL